VIEIDDLPDPVPLACSTCMEPLTWIWVHHLRRNIAVVPLKGVDRWSFRIHTCQMKAERTWRNVQRVPPELTRRGARRARAVLAAQAKKRTEKEDPDE
jgi:hypothetical protein